MINLLLLLILLACLGLSAAWIAENPGNVTIYWFDYRIDTSMAFLFVSAVAAAFAMAFLVLIVRRLMQGPGYISDRRRLRLYRRGLTELTYSVASLAASDIRNAETHTRKAEKLLGRTPLTLLLSAQIARTRGDEAVTRTLLVQMLDHAETEYLAARSLSEVASKKQMTPQALELAQRANKLNPRDIAPVVSLHIKMGQWQEALHAVSKAARKGQITRGNIRRYRGLIYLQQGRQLLAGGFKDGALAAAGHALKHSPDFVPVQIFAARAYVAANQNKKAIKLLTKSWKQSPHPQLLDQLQLLYADKTPEERRAILKKLTANYTPDDGETRWVCHACAHTEPSWEAHCPSCQAFDSLEWKKRELKFVA